MRAAIAFCSSATLVNRGPQSAEVLRWAIAQRARGAHGARQPRSPPDARALGAVGRKKRDTLDGVLGARDCDELVDWLRTRPLVYRENGHMVVHAGILPSWTADDAERLAAEVEEILQSEGRAAPARVGHRARPAPVGARSCAAWSARA